MANPEHVAKLKEGVKAWNKWRKKEKANLKMVSLSGLSLAGTNLAGADFSQSDLFRVNLTEANLIGTDFSEAKLYFAQFENANLTKANFNHAELFRANLTRTNLTGANLNRTSLSEADLTGSNLTHARFMRAILDNANFTSAIGLDTCIHLAPSLIDYRTIQNSGSLPLGFLRGCGLPDILLAYLPSLLSANPVQFYSCFISYSTKDQPFADRLHSDLQNKGVRCWFAPHNMQGGKKLHEQIDEAIRVYDRLLLILSENSMNSEWVKTEIAKARRKETKLGRRVLFPINLSSFQALRDWECFDADTGKDSAREIREYFIPDFSNWKDHDSFQTAFTRLVADLKTEDLKTQPIAAANQW